jgi:hypothetical protein
MKGCSDMTDTKHEAKQNASHTPGPWRVGNLKTSEFGKCYVYGKDGVLTADCVSRKRGLECEANARLIAAAPSLLEALEALLDPFLSIDNPVEMEATFAKARAAVSEAKGLAA